MKTCSKCGVEKPKNEFHKTGVKDRLRSDCKVCANKRKQEYDKTPTCIENRKKYSKTTKSKEAIKRYNQTPHGKKVIEEGRNKYRQTQEGKLSLRKSHLKYKYGITLEQYNDIFRRQGGVCAICGANTTCGGHRTGTFSVDHDHETGEVRGLLCNKCNIMLGMSRDNPQILMSAINYLSRGR